MRTTNKPIIRDFFVMDNDRVNSIFQEYKNGVAINVILWPSIFTYMHLHKWITQEESVSIWNSLCIDFKTRCDLLRGEDMTKKLFKDSNKNAGFIRLYQSRIVETYFDWLIKNNEQPFANENTRRNTTETTEPLSGTREDDQSMQGREEAF